MNEVTNFMYYMYNRWGKDEATSVFGEDLGNHIYGKWCRYIENGMGDLYWYAELDSKCRQKVVDRANEIYASN